MREPHDHIDKARQLLTVARYLLAGGFPDEAGRDAYLAAFHAAQAFIVQQTGKEPKTHSGTRSEFHRLARDDQRLDEAFATFLSRGYGMKAFADYDDGEPVTADEAHQSIELAARMVDQLAALLPSA